MGGEGLRWVFVAGRFLAITGLLAYDMTFFHVLNVRGVLHIFSSLVIGFGFLVRGTCTLLSLAMV